ncbi:MAG: NAD-binding protein [Candidatus Nezhaarchaeota archaeon]|nr:NAD-binding protein [Candidatus Nezhaarchaeota archaeon]
MRVLLIGGGHSAYFAAETIRKIDLSGKLIIVEFTSEKVYVLSKLFPFAEMIQLDIDEVEGYIRANGRILDAVVAATESDSLNLRYCKVAKESNIPLVITIINNPLNAEIFLKEGITFIVNPYKMIPIELSEILDAKVNILYSFHRTGVQVVSIKVGDRRLLSQLKKEMAKNRDLTALFVSPVGEITNSIDEVDVGWRAYVVGYEEKVKRLLRIVEG